MTSQGASIAHVNATHRLIIGRGLQQSGITSCFPGILQEIEQHELVPGLAAPMHGVYFGEMAAQGAARPHLNAANWLHGTRRLRQGGIARRLSSILIVVLLSSWLK